MKLKKIYLKHLGPIDELIIEPRFTENGNPIPIAIVGQNGAGKSLTLSVVLDAMTEARRASFGEIQEVGLTEYLRLSSRNYIRHAASYSHAQAIFTTENGEVAFNEIVSKLPCVEFTEQQTILLNLPGIREGEFITSGFYKNITVSELQKQDIRGITFLTFGMKQPIG